MSTTSYSIPEYLKNTTDLYVTPTTGPSIQTITDSFGNVHYTVWPTRMVSNAYIGTAGTVTTTATLNMQYMQTLKSIKSIEKLTTTYRKFVGQVFCVTDHIEKKSFYLSKDRILDYLFIISPSIAGDFGPDFSLAVRHPVTPEEVQYALLCSEFELQKYFNSRMNESNSNKVHESPRA